MSWGFWGFLMSFGGVPGALWRSLGLVLCSLGFPGVSGGSLGFPGSRPWCLEAGLGVLGAVWVPLGVSGPPGGYLGNPWQFCRVWRGSGGSSEGVWEPEGVSLPARRILRDCVSPPRGTAHVAGGASHTPMLLWGDPQLHQHPVHPQNGIPGGKHCQGRQRGPASPHMGKGVGLELGEAAGETARTDSLQPREKGHPRGPPA